MRIDAEYYRAEILSHIDILDKKKNETLDKLVDFIVGPFGSTVKVDQYVDKSEYRYIRNKDIIDFVINDNEPALIPETVYIPLKQFHIKENDLLITVVGTLGKAAIAQKKDLKSIFSCKSTLLRARSVNPYYLLTYLNSVTGQLFCLRGKRGAIQEGLNLFDLKEIKVYLPNQQFQVCIEKLIKKSFSLLKKSQNLYHQAQHTLLSELGLTDWHPKHRLSFVNNYSNVQQAERIDAEYFQPRYDEIVNAIKTYKGGWNTLGDLVKIKDKNFSPRDDVFYKYIELSNIGSNGEITGCTEEFGKYLPTRARRTVSTGDVIISSIEGSLSSIALITQEFNKALCSTGFYVIDSELYNSETLLCLLKSIAGQMQLKKGCTGTILTAINKDEFSRIVLPNISDQIQETIKGNISSVYESKTKSKQLIEIAQKGVEMAIEQDEETAKEWINMQIKNLDINLNDEE